MLAYIYNMKKIYLLLGLLLLTGVSGFSQAIIELDGTQSMSIAGKGPGQDAAINPYLGSDSIAIVKNVGDNRFSIRIQQQGKILETIEIKPNDTEKVMLLKGYEMYFDSEADAKAKVDFVPKL